MAASGCAGSIVLCFLVKFLSLTLNYQSPSDLDSPQLLTEGELYDFIIVGGGAAGSVLANRLSEVADWKVLLLEAGGEEPDAADIPAFQPFTLQSHLNWYYESEPDSRFCGGKSCAFVTGKGLGGSSLHNEMLYSRGNSRIFDMWEQMGNSGWAFKDVLPYFKKWENNSDPSIAQDTDYHSVGGPQNVGWFPYQDRNVQPLLDAFQELGYQQKLLLIFRQ